MRQIRVAAATFAYCCRCSDGFGPQLPVSSAAQQNSAHGIGARRRTVSSAVLVAPPVRAEALQLASDEAVKVGVLLLNLGGPERAEDVEGFLYNLFAGQSTAATHFFRPIAPGQAPIAMPSSCPVSASRVLSVRDRSGHHPPAAAAVSLPDAYCKDNLCEKGPKEQEGLRIHRRRVTHSEMDASAGERD